MFRPGGLVMKQNVRFVVTIILMVAAVAAVWWLLFRPESETPSGPETVRDETVRESPELPPPAPSAGPDETARRLDAGAVGARVAVDRPAATRGATGGGSLSGLVLDEALEPAPGVEVIIQRTASEQNTPVSDAPRTVTTGPDGTFAADGLPFGSYSLLATRGDLGAAFYAQTGPFRPGVNDLTLQLRPAHSLAGRVTNAQGEFVAGAEVTVLCLPPMGMMRQQSGLRNPEEIAQALPLAALSGDQGGFEFERVPVNQALVAVKAEGYASHVTGLLQLPAAGVTVTLDMGGSVAGRVLQDDTGEPLSGFALRVKGATMVDALEATTNDSGEYVCAGLRPGEYVIEPADELWTNSGERPRVKLGTEEQRQGIELWVTQGGIIRGRVYHEETGAGIPGAAVILRPNLMGWGASVDTDTNGAYELRGVPPGEHSLALRIKDRCITNPYIEQEQALISMKAGGVLEGIDLPVFMGTTISGQVQHADGTPAPSATVWVVPIIGYNRTQVMADQDGAFAVSGVANGEQFRLQASKGTQASAATDTLQVPATGGLDGIVLTLQEGGVIGGTVVTPSGAPLAGMGVLLGREGFMSFQPGYTLTDEAGRFLSAGLAPGLYTLTAMTQGEQGGPDSTAKVELAAGQRVDGVVLTWSKKPPASGPEGNLTISGQVVDDANKPLSDAVVYAHLDGANTNYTTKSLLDGAFSVSGLAPGSYKLSAISRGNRTLQSVDAQAGASGLRLTVSTQGKVSGNVVDSATGKPVTRFGVAFVAPGYLNEPSKQYVAWQPCTSPEGEFTVPIREERHQQSGNLAVAVRADGYAPVEQMLGALSQGQNVEGLLIRMKPGARVEGTVRSSSGQLIAGASVYLDRYDQHRSPETRTDSEGRFTLTNLPMANIKLVAAHPAYSSGEATVTPRAGTTSSVTIELPAGGSVEGIVTAGKQPKAGVGVHLYMFEGGNQQFNTVTDAAGHYVFTNVMNGRGQVATWVQSGSGNLSQSRQIIVETGRTTTANFELPVQTGTLEGFVTVGGQPVSNGQVSAYLPSGEAGTSSYAQLGSDGSYRIESVPVGEVRASVYLHDFSGAGGRQQVETVQIAAGRVTRLDFKLPLPTFVSGFLSGLKEGEAGYIGLLPGEVTIGPLTKEKISEYLGMLAGRAEMNPDGTFRMENVEPGTYTVVGVAADPNASSPEDALINARIVTDVIEVREGEEISVELSIR